MGMTVAQRQAQRTRIGQRLLVARKAKGLSRRELADQIGVTDVTVFRIESGTRGFSGATLGRIAQVLEIPATEVLEIVIMMGDEPDDEEVTDPGVGPPPEEDHEDETPTQLVEMPETQKGVA